MKDQDFRAAALVSNFIAFVFSRFFFFFLKRRKFLETFPTACLRRWSAPLSRI